MILYEYPFNERIRTYLRLEHLFGRLGQLLPREAALDHHFALVTLFEIMDVTSRADLKSDVLKDLEKQKSQMAAYRGNPANVLLAIGLGQAMGLSPAESLIRIDVIQGTPAAGAEPVAGHCARWGGCGLA